MMRRMSSKLVSETLVKIVSRFPVSVLCAVGLFVTDLFNIANFDDFWSSVVNGSNVGTSLALGFFAAGAATLYAESRNLSRVLGILTSVLALAAVGVLCLIVSEGSFFIVLGALLLLLMVAPFLRRGDDNRYFYTFNNALWTGAGSAFILAAILMVGIHVLLQAAGSLLHANVLAGFSGIVFSFCATLFAPLCALAAVPDNLRNPDIHYERASRILVNLILVPVFWGYFAIICTYAAQIALQGSLPSGGLAVIACGFGGVAFATYLIGWFLRDTGPWSTRVFFRFFPYLLVLPLFLMGISVLVRVMEYGITRDRYYLMLFLAWMVAGSALVLARRPPSLKMIPGLLGVLLLLSVVGPWGASDLSLRSQSAILRDILTRTGIYDGATITPANGSVSFTDEKRIGSIVDYILSNDGAELLPAGLGDKIAGNNREARAGVMNAMGLELITPHQKPSQHGENARDLSFRINQTAPVSLDVSGFDTLLRINTGKAIDGWTNNGRSPADPVRVTFDDSVLTFYAPTGSVAIVDLRPFLLESKNRKEGDRSKQWPVLSAQTGDLRVRFYVRGAAGWARGDDVTVESVDGWALIDIR